MSGIASLTPSQDYAASMLAEVRQEHRLKLKNGSNVKSLNELAEALQLMSDELFKRHVSDEKNDFVAWVRTAIKDSELATKLMHAKGRDQAYHIVARRVADWRRIKEGSRASIFTDEFFIGFVTGLIIGAVIALIVTGIY